MAFVKLHFLQLAAVRISNAPLNHYRNIAWIVLPPFNLKINILCMQSSDATVNRVN